MKDGERMRRPCTEAYHCEDEGRFASTVRGPSPNPLQSCERLFDSGRVIELHEMKELSVGHGKKSSACANNFF